MASSDGKAEVQVPDSFETFYRQEFPTVVAVAFGLSGSRHAAEDLAQEAFIRVHREWARVQQMESPGGWVRVVTMNLARSRFRRLRREAAAFARLDPREPTMATTSAEFDDFWMEVGRLPRRQAEVIVLRYIDDLSVSSIAQLIGITDGTVRASLHQGRKRLKERLQAKGITVDEV